MGRFWHLPRTATRAGRTHGSWPRSGPPCDGRCLADATGDGHPAADLDLRGLAPACRAPVLPGRLPSLGETDDGVSSEPVIAALAGDDEALDELLGPARHDLEEQSVHIVMLLGRPVRPLWRALLTKAAVSFPGHCISRLTAWPPQRPYAGRFCDGSACGCTPNNASAATVIWPGSSSPWTTGPRASNSSTRSLSPDFSSKGLNEAVSCALCD